MLARMNVEWLETRMNLTVNGLEQMISDPAVEAKARSVATWAAGMLRERSLIPTLEEVARSEPPEQVFWEVAKALCAMNHGGKLFRELLSSSSDPSTRRAAVFALGCLKERSALESLCDIVADPGESPSLRGQAVEALGYLADENSLPYLIEAAHDSSDEVRFWAAFALGQIGGSEAETVLEEMARTDHASVEGWGEVSSEATEALNASRSHRG